VQTIPNRFTGRELLSPETRRNAELVEERLFVLNTGLHVVFESRRINGPTKNECNAFHVAHATFERNSLSENRTEEIENTTPEILEYLHSPQWTFFIWIPKNVTEGNSQTFAMHYAHELAHHRQNLDRSVLVNPKEFLKSWKKSHSPQMEAERNPDELDAHRVALREFENIFGRNALQSYIDGLCPKMQGFFARLKKLLQEYEAYCQRGL
jgi:hypothetical protein